MVGRLWSNTMVSSVSIYLCSGQRDQDHRAVIQVYEYLRVLKRDRTEGYGGSQQQQLTKIACSALNRIEGESYRYRDTLHDNVTDLSEYGIAFLGAYCAVMGSSLSRSKVGERWVITKTYLSDEDEEHRAQKYASMSQL